MEIRTAIVCLCLLVAVVSTAGEKAVCRVSASTGASGSPPIEGTVKFEDVSTGVKVTVNLEGFTGSVGDKHGFHIHKTGNLANGCSAAEGHYNPDGTDHGARGNSVATRHVGDLGNIVEESGGVVMVTFTDSIIQLSGDQSIMGRAVVIHAGEDDLGLGGDDGSRATGNAGARYACCIIEEDDTNAAHHTYYSVPFMTVLALLGALLTQV